MEKRQVFLCYAHEDERLVTSLAGALKRRGLKVWIDATVKPGELIGRSIDSGLLKSDCAVVVLSQSFFASDWCSKELNALEMQGAFIIPILHGISPEEVGRRSSFLAGRRSLLANVGPEQLADEIAAIKRSPRKEINRPTDCLLCVGSAVGETTLKAPHLQMGSKNLVDRIEWLGGSAYNHASRLLAMGHPVIPIFSVGKDRTGERIQASIVSQLEKLPDGKGKRILAFVSDAKFFCPEFETIESTNIVCGLERTILTGNPPRASEFHRFLEGRLDQLQREFADLNIVAVMIGHLYADSRDVGMGKGTKYLVERFKEKLLFANFGQSQIALGDQFWSDTIRQVKVFQLSIGEMRAFFSRDKTVPSLRFIVDSLHEIGKKTGASAVITLDRFGALAICGHKPGVVYVVWPYELSNVVDTTGAGDAFGAGLVASYCQNPSLLDALEKASLWAAYACTTLGAANDCPGPVELGRFESELTKSLRGVPVVEVMALRDIEKMLWLFDRAY